MLERSEVQMFDLEALVPKGHLYARQIKWSSCRRFCSANENKKLKKLPLKSAGIYDKQLREEYQKRHDEIQSEAEEVIGKNGIKKLLFGYFECEKA